MKKAVMFLSVIALCVLMAACSNDIELTEENFLMKNSLISSQSITTMMTMAN